MDYRQQIMIEFELHSPEGIRKCFDQGIDPNEQINEEPLLYSLINMYSRGPRFRQCVQVFVEYGLYIEDKVLLAVLLDDAHSLDLLLQQQPTLLQNKYSFHCSFTPLYQASLLHICAEFNHVACAKTLLEHGMDVNIKAGVDQYGFGGKSPIFHTVNQDANKNMELLHFLVTQHADLHLTVQGLIWGKGYPWETFVPAVNPISYAMMGLLRQFQRTEKDIYEVVLVLLKAAYDIDYVPPNIPNRYLNS